ncbi:MAG: sensor histidine kinase, partial [Ktedonobacterales bacterium]
TPDAVLRYIHICQQQADALERLVADLFAYTRMEYLEELAVREPVELGDLLHQSVEYMRPQAEAKGIVLDVCPASEACPLVGDAHLLARAISNLLDNALRHAPAGGCVLVRWERTARGCSFAVEDTGSGFHPEDLPHVFEPLYRGDTSRNRATGGAGLGLAIARRIIRAHGGDLTAANASTGGAIVTATFS